jgi:CRP/FNR family transcriptional regulator, cyclic AMP receptor protein
MDIQRPKMPIRNHVIAFNPRMSLTPRDGGWTRESYAARDIIYLQGDAVHSVYYIKNGVAKVTVTARNGKDAVPRLVGSGDFFGESGLIGQALHLATVTAITECSMILLETKAMNHALRNDPHVNETFIDYLLHRNDRAEQDLVDQLVNSSEKRLARVLLLLAETFNAADPASSVLTKLSQETLAEMVGTTRARVNVFMNKFRELDLIEYSGDLKNLRVHKSLGTIILADDELRDGT